MRSFVRFIPIYLALFILVMAGCSSIPNYDETTGPVFVGEYGTDSIEFDGVIQAVSWNIKFSEHIETAIAEYSNTPELVRADILLLQEMDELGVEQIAQAIGLNFVYFPASVHSQHGRNFGNAILSPWPLIEPSKLILPYENPKNDQRRIAAQALVLIDTLEVLTYSVHTETYWMTPAQRRAQVTALLADIQLHDQYVVVGGDFNTIYPLDIPGLVEKFGDVGFIWATSDVGYTVTANGMRFTLDFIFTKGMTVLDSGKVEPTEASDHLPIWAALSPN
ncbi:MAG: endonuclease/exonuclease/phosphatase family protein [Proteobacteria bacterium]|nr:endonuclease/exonuclease/phosphatase family protein [Pseudomonadota bacterium]